MDSVRLCNHLFVFLEEYASWRCGVWKELSCLAKGSREVRCPRAFQTGMSPQHLGPRSRLWSGIRPFGRRRTTRPGVLLSPLQTRIPPREQGLECPQGLSCHASTRGQGGVHSTAGGRHWASALPVHPWGLRGLCAVPAGGLSAQHVAGTTPRGRVDEQRE